MRKNRISETIGSINQKFVNEANSYTGEAREVRRPAWMKWGAIAACFALIAVLSIGVFQGGLFGGGEQIATLDNGTKISFVKSESEITNADIAFQIETRDLTASEIKALFGELPVSAHAVFNAEDQSIIGLEGKCNDMKMIVSVPDMMLKDTVIEGEEGASNVGGVSVKAGYFISGNTVIYYAIFKLDENTVYIENAGMKEETETVKEEIASAIQSFIALEQVDLSSITK